MTKGQIVKLKLLGYEYTQEDGAVLQHPYCDFIWKEDTFNGVLAKYNKEFEHGLRCHIGHDVTYGRNKHHV